MKPVNGAVASEPARDELRERRDASPSELTRADRENLMRFMLMMRAAEERAITLYRQGKVPEGSTTAAGRSNIRSARPTCSGRATGCASCTATSVRISSAG